MQLVTVKMSRLVRTPSIRTRVRARWATVVPTVPEVGRSVIYKLIYVNIIYYYTL